MLLSFEATGSRRIRCGTCNWLCTAGSLWTREQEALRGKEDDDRQHLNDKDESEVRILVCQDRAKQKDNSRGGTVDHVLDLGGNEFECHSPGRHEEDERPEAHLDREGPRHGAHPDGATVAGEQDRHCDQDGHAEERDQEHTLQFPHLLLRAVARGDLHQRHKPGEPERIQPTAGLVDPGEEFFFPGGPGEIRRSGGIGIGHGERPLF